MQTELLKQLVNDPGRWPYYLAFAAVVWFIFKFVGSAAETLWSHTASSLKDKKRLLHVCTSTIQIISIAIAVYFFNLFFWSSRVTDIADSPQVIASRMTLTDKGFLLMSIEVSNPDLFRRANASNSISRMSEISCMKTDDIARLIENSHQNLIRLGLIEDVSIESGPNNAIGYPTAVTPNGIRVLNYLIDNDML